MDIWTFNDFLEADGTTNLIWLWFQSLPKGVRTKVKVRFEAKLDTMRVLEQSQWPPGWISALTGFHEIYELRILVKNTQYRPLGFYGPDRHHFTFVMGAIERNNEIIPRNAFQTAIKRMEIARKDRRRVREHQPYAE